MNIKVLKKVYKKIYEFEKEEWDVADKEHYGQAYDWNPKKFVLVAYENTNIVGTLEFHIKVGVAEIETLIVSEQKRGQGIGKELLAKVEKIAKDNNVHKLYLITGNGWNAEKVYQKFGMVKTGDMPNHYAKHNFVEYSKFI